MEQLISIFVTRDGMDEDEARTYVEDLRQDLHAAIYAGEDAEDWWQDETGLEPDYMTELLYLGLT